MSDPRQIPCIYVLSGTNGAGKSSIAGAMFLSQGVEYFNPDEAAREIASQRPGISVADANSEAWHEGKRLLERAIQERLNFAFETTLGGRSMVALLEKALEEQIEVRIWYVGLATVELHIARVKARVKLGGHDIAEEQIRERFLRSRLNLIRLIPNLTELFVYDNSEEADPNSGKTPEPKLLLHMERGSIHECCDLDLVPEWAKPILARAIK